MRTPLALAALIAGTVIAACAATVPGAPGGPRMSGRQCFLASQVNGFFGATDDSVFINVGARDVYHLQVSGMCQDIDWATRIGFQSRGGGSWVCDGLDAELLIPGPFRASRCLVTDIRKLSPEEAKVARNRK